LGHVDSCRSAGLYRNWTLKASLIRNLEEVSWFGTLRVIEEDKTPRQLPEREAGKAGNGKQGLADREDQEAESTTTDN